MNITVNGLSREIDMGDAATVARVIEVLDLRGKRVAVERNGAIVSRSRYEDTVVQEDDRIEIVSAVGGG